MPCAPNSRWPSGVLQRAANSSVTYGTTWMSAYSACPARSVAIVLTHGTPCVRDSTFTMSLVLCDRPSSNHVLRPRMLSRFASRIAYAVVDDQSSGRQNMGDTTGPYREAYRVRST